MASTAPTTTPAPPPEEFDPLEFWIRHRSRIILYTSLAIAALLVVGIYEFAHQRMVAASEQAFTLANKPEEFQKVIAEYPKLPAAAAAELVLAGQQRDAGKLDESNATLKAFIDKHPQHPMLSGAYTSMAANQTAAGKLDDALNTYKKVTATWPSSFSAAPAWLGEAQILQKQGKTEEARHAYETIVTQFPESPFASEAFRQSQKLKK
jgi:predicted negative regulator of RcsB-dependent stress response